MGPVNGVLAKYTKSSPDDPTIGTWETGIGVSTVPYVALNWVTCLSNYPFMHLL